MANASGGQITWNLDIESSKFTSELNKASQQAKIFGTGLKSIDFSRFAKDAGSSFSLISDGIESTVKKLALLTIGSGAIGTAFVRSAAELQQTNQGFQTLIGNTEVANKLFGQLVKFANVTPFESKEITSAARTLLGFGTNAEQTYDIVKKLGDVAGATGADFSSLSLVTGQIFAQGRIQAQDFYQIINSGAGALGPLIAKNLGKNGVGDLREAFERGEVSADSFFKALTQATEQGGFAFQGAQKQAETFNGRLSTLKDSITKFGLALIGVKIDDKLGFVVEPGGIFDRLGNFVKNLAPQLERLAPKIAAFIDLFVRNGPTVVAAIEGIAAAFVVAKLAAIGFAIYTSPISLTVFAIVAAVTILIAILVFLQQRFDILGVTFRFITGVGSAVGSFFVNLGQQIFNTVVGFVTSTISNIESLVRFFLNLPSRILGAIGNLGSLLYNAGRDLIQGLLNGAGSLLSKMGQFMADKLPSALQGPFKKALGISSPSKVFAGYGQNITQGLIQGINGTQSELGNTMSSLGNNLGVDGTNSFKTVLDTQSLTGTASNSSPAVNSPVKIELNMSGIMARSRNDLREISKDMIESVNESLRARRLPEIGGGQI